MNIFKAIWRRVVFVWNYIKIFVYAFLIELAFDSIVWGGLYLLTGFKMNKLVISLINMVVFVVAYVWLSARARRS